ncbi:MAG TPA: DoxX family protein [Gemmatimonadaceae bacterium]|nr:DoxX family protein [Gemmatimonadaceae bacterium]
MRAFYNPSLGLLVLRLGLGIIFMAHGAQKLFGWFGGAGIEGTAGFFASLGIPAPEILAWVVAILEVFGGLLVILGMFTRVIPAFLAIDVTVALFTVHLPAGFFVKPQGPDGIEFVLIMAVASLTLAFSGAGAYSLDAKREGPTGAEAVPI